MIKIKVQNMGIDEKRFFYVIEPTLNPYTLPYQPNHLPYTYIIAS